MKERQRNRFITATGMISAISGMVACLVSNVSSPAIAQQANIDAKPGFPAFAPGMIDHMQAMRRFKDPDRGAQQTPPVIPKFEMDNDAAGGIATLPARRRDLSRQQCVLPRSRYQRPYLFHLPPAAKRLDGQRGQRRCPVRGQ